MLATSFITSNRYIFYYNIQSQKINTNISSKHSSPNTSDMINICHDDDGTPKNLDNPIYDCTDLVGTSSDGAEVKAGHDNVPGPDYECVELSPDHYNTNGNVPSRWSRKEGQLN